jgi:F-type H+-transporting ATPase subunit b
MHLLVLLQEAAEQAAAGAAEPVEINWLRVGLSWVNFIVLVVILVRFGGPVIRDMLRKRHEGIRRDLDEALALRVQAEGRLHEYEGRLAGIEQEIANLIAGIKREAEAEAARIVATATEAAERIRRDAEFVLKQEGRRLELELRREAAELAVELAKQLLTSKLTDADQQKLTERFVREMATGAAPRSAAGG